ncbi:hypothetical protein NUW58_g10823 [Xylaria curta]|uniref:Uncharacterized protein n=1 Tax=Xylaria curta TaxID=42375 RepID=A0ACC1MGB4_9PEZI|nr:hypothetical protein NUW58_g10823 [Xylaria curta]
MADHVPSSAQKSGEAFDSLGNAVEIRPVASNDVRGDSINRDYGTTSTPSRDDEAAVVSQGLQALEGKKVRWYSYLTTRDFWIVLVIGQVLALAITATNTPSSTTCC